MPTLTFLLAFFTQLSLLVTCTFLLGMLKPHLKTLNVPMNAIVDGSLLGVFALLLMLNPIRVADGVFFDLRNVIIAVAGAFGGGIPAVIVSLLVIIYRLSLGGIGAPVAVGGALTSAVLGVGLYIYRKQHTQKKELWLISLGLAVALQSFVWLRLLPPEIAQQTFSAIGFPILLAYPLSSWLFGFLLLSQQRHRELEVTLSEERTMLRALIDNVPDYIFIKDRASRYRLSNMAHAHAAGATTPADLIGKTAADFFPTDYVQQHDLDDQAVLRGERLIVQERKTVNEDGTPIWVLTTKVPLQDTQGEIIGIVGISRNITERKQAEEALQRERNLLRTLIDTIPANVYIKDTESRFVDANAETALKLGKKTPNALIGKTDFDFFPLELAAKYRADEQTVLQSGQPLLNIEEMTMDQRTQQLQWLLTTKAPIRNEYGEVTGLVGVGLNITARKQAEQALQTKIDAERRFQTALEGLSAISIELTRIDRLDDFYRRVVELALERLGFERFGLMLYDAEHFNVVGTYGTDTNGRVVPEHGLRLDPAALTGILKRTLETTERFVFDEHTQLFSNLEPIGFGWNAVAILWNGAQSLGWVAADNGVHHQPVSQSLLDILALYAQTVGTLLGRKRVEEALREHEAKLQTFFEVLPVGVSVLNREGQILEMNPALARILAMSMDGILTGAYHSRQYLHNDGTPMHLSEFPSTRARAEQQAVHDVVVGVIKEDGATVWTSVSATPLPGENADVITVTTDITERKRAEVQTLALATERQRVQVLHQFISDATHDLMTPIAIINTSTDLARRAPSPERRIAHLDKIAILSEKLQNRLQDMFTMSRLDMATATNIDLHQVDLAQLLQRLVEGCRPKAQAKGQQLISELDPLAGSLQGDGLYLSMALAKVIENSIHYTESGGTIHISIARREGQIAIIVRDTGIGIAEADLPHIFERFYRAKSHRPLDAGAGLGLSITQRIIELHGGRLEVTSVVGSGSTFTLLLPDGQ